MLPGEGHQHAQREHVPSVRITADCRQCRRRGGRGRNIKEGGAHGRLNQVISVTAQVAIS